MKNKFNTLHKFIFEYSKSECTKETLNGLFRSVLEPVVSEPKAEACILLKLDDRQGIDSMLKRLSFTGREIFSFNDSLSDMNIQNISAENLWENTNFLIVSAKRYSAALMWDYSISESNTGAKTLLLVNSKIVTDILKTVLDNSSVTNKKEIVQKYNADRRENVLLNKSVNNIVSLLNDKTDEFITASIENSVLNSQNDDVKTAKTVTDNARLVAHEIKNNISVINLYSNILKKRLKNIPSDNDEAKSVFSALDNILAASENISVNINELREISLPLYEEFNLYDFLSGIISLSRFKLTEKNINVNLSGDKQTSVYTDKKKLTSVIQNVIYNACDACKNNGNISVGFTQDEKETSILISNDGEKIVEDAAEKIFERDFTTKANGNGLGLYICKNIMSLLNGDIKLVSSEETSTVFEITF